MQEVIAGLEHFTFAFEQDVELQTGTGLLPFQGMDKSGSAVCNFFAKGLCEKGKLCPLRHERGEKSVVCKHWLRGLCDCSNRECSFRHEKPAFKSQDCPWYDQGFCKEGPLCKYRHVRQTVCLNYFTGFCPEGPKCQFAHPKMHLVFHPSYVKLVSLLSVSAPPPESMAQKHLPCHLSGIKSSLCYSIPVSLLSA
uniref:Cleavage and polyadenylation specificity factor subunit 4 n=1 Tax=Castor canadensis TaxID=51338 RepID=A0A8B7UF36_CASCN|nr:putative cleavage and polyadenylation specificity factor subunit 4-like protein [Castor canadensis]